jgi:hypothetical protein
MAKHPQLGQSLEISRQGSIGNGVNGARDATFSIAMSASPYRNPNFQIEGPALLMLTMADDVVIPPVAGTIPTQSESLTPFSVRACNAPE